MGRRPLTVERQGKRLTVFVSREVIEDLGALRGEQPKSEYLRVLEMHMGRVLGALRNALKDGVAPRADGRILLQNKYIFPELAD